jgi:hypothetical protein
VCFFHRCSVVANFVDASWLVTPLEACSAMNKKLTQAKCEYLSSAFKWSEKLTISKKAFHQDENKLNSVHIVEVSSLGMYSCLCDLSFLIFRDHDSRVSRYAADGTVSFLGKH